MTKANVTNRNRLNIACSLAYYLPQFHRIPENDRWWGDGFTEWSSLREAFPRHPHQVILTPGELGYYDLREQGVMERQYALAQQHDIDTFALWHYWFGEGDMLLEKPAEQLLQGDEEVEFCFAWANHDWIRRTTGAILKRQTYDADPARHFAYLEPYFHDRRYRRIDGEPVFILFAPMRHPHLARWTDAIQELAQRSGLGGLCLIFDHCHAGAPEVDLCRYYCNSTRALKFEPRWQRLAQKVARALRSGRRRPDFAQYDACVEMLNKHIAPASRELPVVLPGWDSTVRHGTDGLCLLDATPEAFARQLDRVRDILAQRPESERVLIIKSWNEWAEGNVLEPTDQFGSAFLETFGSRFEVVGTSVAPC